MTCGESDRIVETSGAKPSQWCEDFAGQFWSKDGERALDVAKMPQLSAEAKLLSDLNTELDSQIKADNFAGAVLIAKGGEVIFNRSGGLADQTSRQEVQARDKDDDTRFRFGSMGKMFTAVAVLQLAQSGKLNLEDKLINFLPDFPDKNFAERTTIHQLLTHTSGAGDFFGPEFNQKVSAMQNPVDDFLNFYFERGLPTGFHDPEQPRAEVGKFNYSNFGYALLGKVIEGALKRDPSAENKNYYDYVRENIFSPAGMTNTGNEPEAKGIPHLATSYHRTDAGLQPTSLYNRTDNADLSLPARGGPAGGGYATVHDMLRFASALQSNKLLNPEFTRLLTEGKVRLDADDPSGHYAYGLGTIERGGSKFLGHGGAAPGTNGELRLYLNKPYIVVVLSNRDAPAAIRLADFVDQRLQGK